MFKTLKYDISKKNYLKHHFYGFRLGLERASTALDCVKVITTLLEKHGQGGPCSEDQPDMIYHNSFLITDRKDAYVLETAGKEWAAEKIDSKKNSLV